MVITKGSANLTEYSVSVNGTVVQSGGVSATTINISEETIKKGIATPASSDDDSSSSSSTKPAVSTKVRVTVKDANGFEASDEL